MEKLKNLNRVAIIGCGYIGANSAYSLLLGGTVEELVLIDPDANRLLGKVMDLQHSVPLVRPVRIWAGDYNDAALADIVVIAAGADSHPGETCLDLLDKNVVVIREIMGKLKAAGFAGIVLMTTNPVDILAQVAQEESGLPAGKVIGSGMVLDTARLRAMLGEQFGVEAGSIQTYTIGEHGDSEIATWCGADAGGAPLVDFCNPDCPGFGEMLEKVRSAAPETARRKGYTSDAVASCVTKICETILRDERSILPVSTLTSGQYGISGVYLSLPCVVGINGVERIVELPLDETERAELMASAELLDGIMKKLKSKTADAA